MSKTVRVRTTPNGDDAYLKVKVDQDFDFIEILSLKISQAEAYSRFCSDYGVVVGRVIVNNGFGIPNAKVSIFVPLTDEDEEDSEIKGLYPFKVIDDKDSEGIRYNLLQTDPNPLETCFTPVGTFPAKREVIDNDTTLEVYDKYYKFTTVTNDAGDFMLFGVPTGSHVLNVDVDLSDIGIASQRPYDYIGEGESEKRFDSPTKFKGDKDLDKLIQVKSYKKGVQVQPFWGDKEQCDIGITRLDIDIKKKITPTAIFMGSLFSDSDKNSVNKNCRPRKNFGRLCETETGQGSVEMIRKTLDGKIERFDVEGGRVVNEFGSWAYQVPMNLDVLVTDEFGNLVPSSDPNKGIATSAKVRFRIGKDVSGSEGRLRTTAKYLVPNNPANSGSIDYNFDENTTDESFRTFHWNKIYSVSNFIPRVQANCIGPACADNRNMTGIKDVDDCSGLKNPFPFNRVDTDFNPLFTIICIIMSIIVLIIFLINSTVIAFVNLIIYIINKILKVICDIVYGIGQTIEKIANLVSKIPGVSWSFDACSLCIGNGCCECENILSYVPCITLTCENQIFAPGCNCSGVTNANAPLNSGSNDTSGVGTGELGCWAARTQKGKNIEHWSGINPTSTHCPHDGHGTPGAGFTDCIAIKLAESLNMFEFDFYNDWINGSLYTYLLKFKKKKRGKKKFCDSECDEGFSDNGCDKSWFVDTCGDGRDGRIRIKSVTKTYIDEGFIKMITKKLPDGREEDTLYYAPYARKVGQKLFATELIHLGSVFDCDWQGIPKIQPLLTPTSYNRPPYIDEYLFDAGGNTTSTKTACGMTSTGSNGTSGVFFDIDCLGLTVGQIYGAARCDNFKRQCEFGVNIDEADLSSANTVITAANCYLNDTDLAQPYADRFRDIFYQLNINDGSTKLDSWPVATANGLPAGIDTGFGVGTGNATLGAHYKAFRGHNGQGAYAPTNSNFGGYTQPKNSFYFYFGTAPGQGGLDLMNRKYFTPCEPVIKNDFIISGIIDHVETAGACDGEIAVTVVGGEAPYIYNYTGPTNYVNPSTSIGDLTGLCGGVYNLTVTDANGGTSTISFTVNEPASLTCNVVGTDSLNSGGNGSLFITAFGGTPDYFYSINGNPAVSMAPNSSATVPMPAGSYIVDVIDNGGNGSICTTPSTGVTISEPPALSIQGLGASTTTTCGFDNGTISILLSSSIGGTPPYSTLITGNGYSNSGGGPVPFSSAMMNVTNLEPGTYTVTTTDSGFAVDASGNTIPSPQMDSITFTIGTSIAPNITITPDWYCWFYPSTVTDSFINILAGNILTTVNGSILQIEVIEEIGSVQTTVATLVGATAGTQLAALPLKPSFYRFILIDTMGCVTDTTTDLTPGSGQVPSAAQRMEYIPENYCWSTTTNPNIKPKFQVWVDGPFQILNGGTVIHTDNIGVPNGTIIQIATIQGTSTGAIFTLRETTNNCDLVMSPINLTAQHPSSRLAVTVAMTTPISCGGSPNPTGVVTATGSGGWNSSYSYAWYVGSTLITNLNPATLPSSYCGSVMTCRITDNEGCIRISAPITIT